MRIIKDTAIYLLLVILSPVIAIILWWEDKRDRQEHPNEEE